jgi:murein DD-endopeptidase MepM/ murein hydrolase activator NlpD
LPADRDGVRFWIATWWTCPYYQPFEGRCWPTEHRVITQAFGANPDYYKQFGLPGHDGLDFRAPEGSPIFAIDAGRVITVYRNPLPKSKGGHNYGIHLRVGHNSAYESIYAHLSQVSVSSGSVVDAGTLIGLAGNTGNSRGAHLHLTLKHRGKIVDPTPHLRDAALAKPSGRGPSARGLGIMPSPWFDPGRAQGRR